MAVTKKTKKSLSSQRAKQVVESAEVKVLNEIPLEETPAPTQETPVAGLREYLIEGTALTLLALEDPTQVPTLEQRVAMARRLVAVGPQLPQYVQRAKLPAYMFHSSVDPQNSNYAASKERVEAEEKGIPVSRTTTVKKMLKTPGGVQLKRICADIDLDPKVARQIMRSKKVERPGGRWEWPAEQAEEIKQMLKAEAAKL